MSTATMLFKGPALPYHVLDYAISWARENEGSLHALFVVPGNMPEEGYPFPNDLDEAEDMMTERDSQKGLREIIQQEIRYLERRCNASHIPVSSEMLFSPSMQKVVESISSSEIIFIDKKVEEERDDDEMSQVDFRIGDLLRKSSRQVVSIGEKDKFSDVVY
jgi:hypothetical protein